MGGVLGFDGDVEFDLRAGNFAEMPLVLDFDDVAACVGDGGSTSCEAAGNVV